MPKAFRTRCTRTQGRNQLLTKEGYNTQVQHHQRGKEGTEGTKGTQGKDGVNSREGSGYGGHGQKGILGQSGRLIGIASLQDYHFRPNQ